MRKRCAQYERIPDTYVPLFSNNTHLTSFFLGNYGFKSENILLLVDDDHSRGRERPTRDEMFNAMAWLIKDATSHDSLFFHCQGSLI